MSFLRIASKRERRARLFGALFAVATALVAFGFFQGFETDTSGWFPFPVPAVTVVQVPSGNTSSSYNAGTTSPYASGINAATGNFFARVKSGVSSQNCTIDTTGPGPNDSLLCEGPFTRFGITAPGPFPAGGYTTQQDIYLDVNYANHHPDCGTASPIGAPCTPDTAGTVNPACVTNPAGVDCEGSRFTWTVGLNDPTGGFHRDYVFQVGTLPDPHTVGGFGGCTSGGYVINAQYNSFRSGGQPYAGFDPKCIATSGWYTFKEVFTNVGGNLSVDWSIIDSSGHTNFCQDTNGNTVDCTWSASLGSADAILPNAATGYPGIGCPRYGWLANEEINDLAIDNTSFAGDCPQGIQNQITPTDTTCQQFLDGSAATLSQLQYTLKGGKINAVSPGVFFYYTKVTGTANEPVATSQSVGPAGEVSPVIPIQKLQAILYSSTCTKLSLLKIDTSTGTASGKLPSTGDFIIGVKYAPSSLKGQPPPSPDTTATYTFDTELNSIVQHTATINLAPK